MMGFAPGEIDRLYEMKDYRRHRGEIISQHAEVLKNYRRRLANEPGNAADIEAELNAYVKLIPEELRRDVLRRAHQGTEDSVYDQLAARIERERSQEEAAKRMSENGETN